MSEKEDYYATFGDARDARGNVPSTGLAPVEPTLQQRNAQTFVSVISRFSRCSGDVPDPPAGDVIIRGAISERAYHDMLVEGFSRITRDSAERFFQRGGPGGSLIRVVEFPAILSQNQVRVCMSFYDGRVAGAIDAILPAMLQDADRVRPRLTRLVEHLETIERERKGLSSSDPSWSAKTNIPNLAAYIIRAQKKIGRLERPEKLVELRDLHVWSRALLDGENTVIRYTKLFSPQDWKGTKRIFGHTRRAQAVRARPAGM